MLNILILLVAIALTMSILSIFISSHVLFGILITLVLVAILAVLIMMIRGIKK